MMRHVVLILSLAMSWASHAQSEWWFDSEERERDITGVDNREFTERSFKERLTLGGRAHCNLAPTPSWEPHPKSDTASTKTSSWALAEPTISRGSSRLRQHRQQIYGGGVFARQRLITRIFAHAEWEHVNHQSGLFIDPPQRTWTPLLWIGGGYYRGLSDRLGAGFTVLYDVTENPASPYDNPTFRGGLSLGF